MAKCDYMLCDKCNSKVFYDSEVNYDFVDSVKNQIVCLCNECAKKYKIVIKEKNKEDFDKEKEEQDRLEEYKENNINNIDCPF